MGLNVGVIGAGSMGMNHIRILSKMRDIKLVGVTDINKDTLDIVKSTYDVPVYCKINELIDIGLDAVIIAVPTSLHRDIAMIAIEHGIHLLIEKPIAKNLFEAEEIINASNQKNVKLMIGHIERFNPIIPAIKDAISKEKIISIAITRVGPFPPRVKDVGVIIDLGVHDIDLIHFLTDSEYMEINCYIFNNFSKYEDTAILTFKMANGVVAYITTNWITPFKNRTIEIATTKKYIKGDFITMQAKEYSGFEQSDKSYIVNGLNTKIGEPLQKELEAFISSIKNNTEPPVTGYDGFYALEIALKCLENAGINTY